MPPPPSRRLGSNARTYWRIRAASMWGSVTLLGPLVSQDLPGALATLAVAAPILGLLAGVSFLPELRYRRWGYDLDEDEIDIVHGTFWLTRTLIPMRRVQHVEMSQGPLESQMSLATVKIHTAAGEHEIPALWYGDAAELRRRIGELARTADDL